MKNLFVFLRFALTIFVICVIYDLINSKKFMVNGMQLLTSAIIAIIVGIAFTLIFFNKTYILNCKNMDLDSLKNKLLKMNFSLEKENDKELCFRGNWSYRFYVGNVYVCVMEKEIKISGSKYIINKIMA